MCRWHESEGCYLNRKLGCPFCIPVPFTTPSSALLSSTAGMRFKASTTAAVRSVLLFTLAECAVALKCYQGLHHSLNGTWPRKCGSTARACTKTVDGKSGMNSYGCLSANCTVSIAACPSLLYNRESSGREWHSFGVDGLCPAHLPPHRHRHQHRLLLLRRRLQRCGWAGQ